VVVPLISNWALDEDNPTSSDYQVIHFDITSDSEKHILPLTNNKWNWKKADRELFKLRLSNNYRESKKPHQRFHLDLISLAKSPLFQLPPLFVKKRNSGPLHLSCLPMAIKGRKPPSTWMSPLSNQVKLQMTILAWFNHYPLYL
jgi:hypothetical protein